MSSTTMRGLAELEELDTVFGALSHRTRRAILHVLHANEGSMTSGAIAHLFSNSWQTTSRHLRVLEEGGLIAVSLRGRERIYELRSEYMRELVGDWLNRFPPENSSGNQ